MSFRARLAGSIAIFAAAGVMFLPGCSSDSPRDLNWGTDVGLDFIPPDASSSDATVGESGGSVDSNNGAVSVDGSQDEVGFDLGATIDGAN